MRALVGILLAVGAASCNREGSVADDYKGAPPVEQMEMPTANWSTLEPAVGQRPAESGMLTKGPIVTDLHALLGKDAIAYRQQLYRQGRRLHRVGKLLVTASPPGADATYLIVDVDQRALEAGYRSHGRWLVRTTPAADITRPAEIDDLLAS